MTLLQAAPFLIAFLSTATAFISVTGAHLAAEHSKRNGIVPKGTRDFFVFSKNPAVLGVVPSFRAIYSDVHHVYGSRFITGCIQISRVGFAAGLALFVVGVAAAAI
jgi:hypothetical protein